MSDVGPDADPNVAPEAGPDADEQHRRTRANRATRGAMAGVLGLEAIVTLLVPRALAFSDGGLDTTKTLVLVALALVMIAAAGLLRRPWGIGLGSVLQVLFLLSGIWLLALLVIAALFAAVWVRLLWLRHQLLGTPAGWRLVIS